MESEIRRPTKIIRLRVFLNRLKRRKTAILGLVISLFIISLAVIGIFYSPRDPDYTDLNAHLLPPSPEYPFGTDWLGRDLVSRILSGARITLAVGACCVVVSFLIGAPLGLFSGYYRGLLDTLMMRIVDIMLAFPGILLMMIILSILGPGINNVIVAVAIWSVPSYARITRGVVLSIRENEYVHSARGLGASDLRIMFRHILPNVIPSLIVLSTLQMPTAILDTAALSFLGFGVQPPTAEWGAMLSQSRPYMAQSWWTTTFPGLMIFLIVLALNLLGDGLRDALDPRLKL